MMWVGPLFSHPAVGARVRVMAALMVAWVAAPVSVGRLAGAQWDLASLVAAVVVELLVGLTVGVGAMLMFSAMMLLGEFLAVQGGLGAAQAIDPATGVSSPAIGMALESFALLVFLAIDGHHDLIRGIAATFTFLPVGGALPSTDIFLEMARLGGHIWGVAFQIAAPVTVAIFVQNVATGVLGRAMPQLNILIVNLPLHVGIVFLIMGLGASELVHAMKDSIEVWPDTVFGILAGDSHGGG
jgi:flagellar biosynthetic protein FliR